METNQSILTLSWCQLAYAITTCNHLAVMFSRNQVLRKQSKYGSTNKDSFSLIALIFDKFRLILHLWSFNICISLLFYKELLARGGLSYAYCSPALPIHFYYHPSIFADNFRKGQRIRPFSQHQLGEKICILGRYIEVFLTRMFLYTLYNTFYAYYYN